MSIASQVVTDFNSVLAEHGGSIYWFPATSGTLSDWGEIVTGSKYPSSGAIIGIIQEISYGYDRVAQGDNITNSAVCYTKSGNSFRENDKLTYQSKSYEITNVNPNVVEDTIVFYELRLKTL